MSKPKISKFSIKVSELKSNRLIVEVLDIDTSNKFKRLVSEFYDLGVIQIEASLQKYPEKFQLSVSELVDIKEFVLWITDEMNKPEINEVKVDNCEGDTDKTTIDSEFSKWLNHIIIEMYKNQ